jgi:hypothetical protein
MVSQPRHRPQRQFPEAERRIVPCDLDVCPHCGERLHPRSPWHMQKTVQTLKGPVFVAGRSKECVNPACAHVGYHRKSYVQFFPVPRWRVTETVFGCSMPWRVKRNPFGLERT